MTVICAGTKAVSTAYRYRRLIGWIIGCTMFVAHALMSLRVDTSLHQKRPSGDGKGILSRFLISRVREHIVVNACEMGTDAMSKPFLASGVSQLVRSVAILVYGFMTQVNTAMLYGSAVSLIPLP